MNTKEITLIRKILIFVDVSATLNVKCHNLDRLKTQPFSRDNASEAKSENSEEM